MNIFIKSFKIRYYDIFASLSALARPIPVLFDLTPPAKIF